MTHSKGFVMPAYQNPYRYNAYSTVFVIAHKNAWDTHTHTHTRENTLSRQQRKTRAHAEEAKKKCGAHKCFEKRRNQLERLLCSISLIVMGPCERPFTLMRMSRSRRCVLDVALDGFGNFGVCGHRSSNAVSLIVVVSGLSSILSQPPRLRSLPSPIAVLEAIFLPRQSPLLHHHLFLYFLSFRIVSGVLNDCLSAPSPYPIPTLNQQKKNETSLYVCVSDGSRKADEAKKNEACEQCNDHLKQRAREHMEGGGGEMSLAVSDTRIACAASQTSSSRLNIPGTAPLAGSIGPCVLFCLG